MGKASSVGMDVRRRNAKASAADTNPHLRRQWLQKFRKRKPRRKLAKFRQVVLMV